MATISFQIPNGNITEVKAAIDHHIGTAATVGWDNDAYLDWYKARARAALKNIVINYRESQQAAVDQTDPTTD